MEMDLKMLDACRFWKKRASCINLQCLCGLPFFISEVSPALSWKLSLTITLGIFVDVSIFGSSFFVAFRGLSKSHRLWGIETF